jgi:tetratricopeptide (TPR) repeat protein
VVVLVAAGAGILLARSWGERTSAGNSPTGGFGNDGTASQMLSQARAAMTTDPLSAIDLFAQVQQIEPDNVEAITYGAWLAVLASFQSDNQQFIEQAATPALAQFQKAIAIDPSYPDPQCFAAIVEYRALGDAAAAEPYLDTCLASDPPQEAKAFAEALRDAIQADLAAATSSVPPTSTP